MQLDELNIPGLWSEDRLPTKEQMRILLPLVRNEATIRAKVTTETIRARAKPRDRYEVHLCHPDASCEPISEDRFAAMMLHGFLEEVRYEGTVTWYTCSEIGTEAVAQYSMRRSIEMALRTRLNSLVCEAHQRAAARVAHLRKRKQE